MGRRWGSEVAAPDMSRTVSLPLSTVVDGRRWDLYSVHFRTADALTLSTYVYALSYEHALMIVQDLRESAVVEGKVVGVIG